MLSKQTSRPAIRGIILTSLLTLLSSCGNSAAIENLIGADPDLKEGSTTEVSDRDRSKSDDDNTSPANRDSAKIDTVKQKDRSNDDKSQDIAEAPDRVRASDDEPETSEGSNTGNLLLNPNTFPVYPQAELQEVQSSEDEKSGKLIWQTMDNRQAVADFYLAELSTNDWDVIKPFTIDPQQKVARAIAVKDDLRVELSLVRGEKDRQSSRQGTKLSVVYHPLSEDIPPSSISRLEPASELESDRTQPKASDRESEQLPENEQQLPSKLDERDSIPQAKLEPNSDNSERSVEPNFADLDEVPIQLQQPLESVAALSILTPFTGKSNVELSKFAPNETITRAEYARWLITANNRYYADNPGKKIYVPAQTTQPAFKDVNPSHPDFAAIQSLAEAGLIPSRLTEDSNNLLFKPNAPLTREDLVTWKVPLDTRQSLPKASIKAIEDSWGFRDAAKIDSSAVQALYADFQNGDRANIRRIYGYTTLFQPKKPVTRAEAAASLWYFGFQGDGITAKEILESEADKS